jgi:hypothetical protein
MTDLTHYEEVVDGQTLQILDEAGLMALLQNPSLAGPGLSSWARWTAQIVYTRDELALAWHSIGLRDTPIWLCLLWSSKRRVRVDLEILKCIKCKEEFVAANPTSLDLFIGIVNETKAREAAWAIPVIPCPICCTSFVRRVVWAMQLPTALR